MSVPQYQQQIEPEATQATTPEELHPVAAAFGGDIGAALEKSGEQISGRIEQLSQHMALMNYYRSQQNVADKVLQMKTDQDNVLYSQDPKEITRNPSIDNTKPTDLILSSGGVSPSNISPAVATQTFTVPTGLLLRKDNAADGVTQEYHDWYNNYSQQMISQAQSEGMGLRAIRQLKLRMDSDFASNGRYIAGHEAEQLNNGRIKTFTSVMQADANSSNLAQDSQSLGLKIDSINKTAVDLSASGGLLKNPDGSFTDAHVNTTNKFVGQALDNSMAANLKLTNGDPAQFQSILDRLHDDGRINDTQYNVSSDHLGRASKAIISQNETRNKIQTVNVRMDAFNKLGQGKFDISNQSLIDDYASKDPELGNALQTVAESRGQYKPERNDAQNREFQKSVTDMINSSSQDQLSGYMTKMLSAKDGMSQTHLNIVVNALMNHAKTLPVIDGMPNSPIPQNTGAMAFNALSKWADTANLSVEDKSQLMTNYLDGMSKAVAPRDNYNNAIQAHMREAYPKTSTMEFPPTDIDNESRGFNKAVNFAADAKIFPQQRLNVHGVKENGKPIADKDLTPLAKEAKDFNG